MRILLTNTGSRGTGSFTAVESIVDELTRLGHQVRVFYPEATLQQTASIESLCSPQYHPWQFPIQGGGEILSSYPLMIPDPHPANLNAPTYKDLTKSQFELFISRCQQQLAKLIEEFKPDVIESNHLWIMAYLLRQLGVPYFCTSHNSDQMGFKYDERMRPFAIEAAQGAETIFAISPQNRAEVIKVYGVDPQKVAFMPNGFNRKIFYPYEVDRAETLAKLGVDIPADATIVNLAGKISKTKGVDILLRANALIPKSKNIHIIILGAGEFANVLSAKELQQLDLSNVHVLGHVTPKTVADVHNLSHISLLPSRSEGFPISCLEAMGCGLPVVISQLAGLEEIAVGRVIAQESAEQLASGICELCELSENDYRSLSVRAITASHAFLWEQIVADRLAYYQAILHETGPAYRACCV